MSASRRNFLKTLCTLPFAATLAREAESSVLAHVPPSTPSPARRLLLNRFSIAGFQYYDGPALIHRLGLRDAVVYEIDYGRDDTEEFVYHGVKSTDQLNLHPGRQLDLKAEPGNPHDPFAVEIYLGKIKLGYVPRSDNKHISRLLDQGVNMDCRVIEIDPEAGVWNMVRVEVGVVIE
jgi:hypothetical protein